MHELFDRVSSPSSTVRNYVLKVRKIYEDLKLFIFLHEKIWLVWLANAKKKHDSCIFLHSLRYQLSKPAHPYSAADFHLIQLSNFNFLAYLQANSKQLTGFPINSRFTVCVENFFPNFKESENFPIFTSAGDHLVGSKLVRLIQLSAELGDAHERDKLLLICQMESGVCVFFVCSFLPQLVASRVQFCSLHISRPNRPSVWRLFALPSAWLNAALRFPSGLDFWTRVWSVSKFPGELSMERVVKAFFFC